MITLSYLKPTFSTHHRRYLSTALAITFSISALEAQVPDTLISLRNSSGTTRMSLHVMVGCMWAENTQV